MQARFGAWVRSVTSPVEQGGGGKGGGTGGSDGNGEVRCAGRAEKREVPMEKKDSGTSQRWGKNMEMPRRFKGSED